MSERNKPHNGRDLSGDFKVRQIDVEETLEDPRGVDYLKDDVRLGGAVEDVGMNAGRSAERVERMIEDNREDVERATGKRPINRHRRRK